MSAGAAPTNAKNALRVPINCGSAGTFTVVSMGNGAFTPGHIVGSNAVLIPIAFGPFTGTFTPASGGPPETFVELAVSKPAPNNGKPVVHCSFTVTDTSPEGTFTGSGTVTAFFSHR